MKKVLVAMLLFLAWSLAGCGPPHNTLYLRDELQPFCRENDAIVLASSQFFPKGRIYFLEKQEGQWRKSQVIDLIPYLKDGSSKWYTLQTKELNRTCNDYLKTWLAYNDHFLVVTVRKSSTYNKNGTMRDARGRAIIFKKVNGVWEHYYTLDSEESFVWVGCVALTDDDQLIVSDPFKNNGETKGVVRCFDLTGDKPRLIQEIYPSEIDCTEEEKRDPLIPDFGYTFFVDKNTLFIELERNVPDASSDMSVGGIRISINKDYLLYRFNNERWNFVCSFQKLIPPNVWNRGSNIYSMGDVRGVFLQDLQNGKILFQNSGIDCGGFLFSLKEKGCEYEQGELFKAHLNEDFPCVQKPFVYAFEWRGKRERFALAKPSPDGTFRVVEPDWIVEDADLTTNKLVSDFFRYDYKPDDIDYIQKLGYKSFYDYTSYIPTVDYSLSGTTLATSYYFDACYLPNSPVQKAEVWGGVNIYEIDPEKGPVKKFALTTRNLEELKEVPLNAETPEEEKPFDSKILDKYFQ
ncbi:MAG: hypothetical protein IKX88_10555 [Thermoguttaceae bacterium]|nr:hypothetical protein [Thermoguttaceae bacterium]